MKLKTNLKLGIYDVPDEYENFTQEQRNVFCDYIIDKLYTQIDRTLDPRYDRIEVMNELLETTEILNSEKEIYEVAAVIRDCRRRLNED